MTLLPGVVMNIRPWFTIGVVAWASTRSVLSDQAKDRFPMFFAVIWLRRLKPEPLYVRSGTSPWSSFDESPPRAASVAAEPMLFGLTKVEDFDAEADA